jgi:hypothetical protein
MTARRGGAEARRKTAKDDMKKLGINDARPLFLAILLTIFSASPRLRDK